MQTLNIWIITLLEYRVLREILYVLDSLEVQWGPSQPAGHKHTPITWWHWPPFRHSHFCWHSRPWNPWGHTAEKHSYLPLFGSVYYRTVTFIISFSHTSTSLSSLTFFTVCPNPAWQAAAGSTHMITHCTILTLALMVTIWPKITCRTLLKKKSTVSVTHTYYYMVHLARRSYALCSQWVPVYPASQWHCPVTGSQFTKLLVQLHTLRQLAPQCPGSHTATKY